MSESNKNTRSTMMEVEAAANKEVAAVSARQDGRSNGEFVVHTKHTCDSCFMQPIIGKRYTSNIRSNFDLCSNCYDAYSGPDIGLVESLLARDKKHSRDFVLKLKIIKGGDEQVRRVTVAEIWGASIAHLSFGKMMFIASSFASPGVKVDDAGLVAFIAKAKATYIDEDGDKINMTSNAELEDAFRQVLKKFPLHKPFRITVTIPNDDNKAGNATGMPKRIQLRKVDPSRKVFKMSTDELPLMNGKSKTTLRVAPQKFEKDFFIHARHTCDGCSKTPIIGTRYHATKIPDFDLCGACFERYEGEDLDFKPEIHERDRNMQQKWLQTQLVKSAKVSGNIVGMWNEANGDLSDFLKKVQASGASIESATVYACPSAKDAAPAPEVNNSGKSPSAENAATDSVAQPMQEDKYESVKVGSVTEAEPMEEETQEESDKVEAVKAAEHMEEETHESAKAEDAKEAEHMEEETKASAKVKYDASKGLPTMKSETPTVDKVPSSVASPDDSFLSDADGSIAEAIGRTLDVCVAAIEEVMADDTENRSTGNSNRQSQKSSVEKDVASAAADAFSVASSMVSSMTDVLKKMEEARKTDVASQTTASQSHHADGAAASTGVPSVVTGATILESEDGSPKKEKVIDMCRAEDASFGEDEWSVLDDEKSEEDKSVWSAEPLAPVLLAKWDTELHQLHELGFLDDRKNVDVLEALEASHVGVGSTEKVTIDAALGRLLGDR